MPDADVENVPADGMRNWMGGTSRDTTDLDLEAATSEDEDYDSAPPKYNIVTYPADFTLEVLYQKWKTGEINIPPFQRRFVWRQIQASKLIESFLLGLPVPAVFFYSERKSRKYLVIDGQQRLRSVFDYFDGRFGSDEQRFKLIRLDENSPFHERTFDDLLEPDQRRLKNSVLRAFIVEQIEPDDDTSMYHIFERLNTGGTLLANQEIRNCIFHGSFVEFLERINRLPNWRNILGREEPDSRRKDMELLVRFFAMRNLKEYKKPMKDFLSRYMRNNRNPSQEDMRELEDMLTLTCNSIIDSLGKKPFHVRAGLNASVFDAVMVAFSNHLAEIPPDIRTRYERLLGDPQFEIHTRQGTTDVERVQTRFRMASQQLFGG